MLFGLTVLTDKTRIILATDTPIIVRSPFYTESLSDRYWNIPVSFPDYGTMLTQQLWRHIFFLKSVHIQPRHCTILLTGPRADEARSRIEEIALRTFQAKSPWTIHVEADTGRLHCCIDIAHLREQGVITELIQKLSRISQSVEYKDRFSITLPVPPGYSKSAIVERVQNLLEASVGKRADVHRRP